MASTTQANGSATRRMNGKPIAMGGLESEIVQLNLDIKNAKHDRKNDSFHGDQLIGDKVTTQVGLLDDIRRIFVAKNLPAIGSAIRGMLPGGKTDVKALAVIAGSMSNDSKSRKSMVDQRVKGLYNKMLHPPLTYLGDAFQYRQADGKYNNVMSPHLGQAGAPYAKTVPSKTHPLGALPDPGDLFDRLLAREDGGRNSTSGLSSMLIYHATIIIHDIFRTNDNDKNISDSSSYLDLSPLYGYTMEMQRKIRDDEYKLGLLKPDVFAEDRLLRQPPGVCIMLVMYNRYHNYAATQLRRINENGRFSVPSKYTGTKLEAMARKWYKGNKDEQFAANLKKYNTAWKANQAKKNDVQAMKDDQHLEDCTKTLEDYIAQSGPSDQDRKDFGTLYDAAWDKLDDDLFNTARLITCGMYIQVAIHDYLRALMGFHQFNTNFTLDPRSEIDHKNVSRGIGNQVTVEFNLLYRFHCAISQRDEAYTEEYIKAGFHVKDAKDVSVKQFIDATKDKKAYDEAHPVEPKDQTFGLYDPKHHFARDPITGLFNDADMIKELTSAMDDPISNFGPRNVPRCLRAVEIMGIMQARKWEIGTLNDFREFFGMTRHQTFEEVTKNVDIQNALRDLYEHPDKIELYPGVFCESDSTMNLDPGPSDLNAALWGAIFSDAITLVRSDRFYTVDWNTNSLTSWGMKEVTADNDICKSSVFHRLIQRAFPGWFPYDSIRFFHPFYTSQQNAKFAKEQGYAADFKMSPEPKIEGNGNTVFDVAASEPMKPVKPLYLAEADKISLVIDNPHDFIHPAFKNPANFPEVMQGLFKQQAGKRRQTRTATLPKDQVHEDLDGIMKYFTKLMRNIIKRESITMKPNTYQLDAIRDFAIPVTTQYVADFLGFGHLIRNADNPHGLYSENDIYQHITNCQIFLSYNADETKLFKRRKAFKISLQFLYDLTLDGNIYEASRSGIGQYLFGRKRDNAMIDLGFEVAEHIHKFASSRVEAATILVFVGLHTAYNSVLAFTSVLNMFFAEMYDYANADSIPAKTPTWQKVQELAFSETKNSFEELMDLVLQAERTAIRLPVVRTATKDRTDLNVKAGETVICDIHRANTEALKAGKKTFLNHKSSATEMIADYDPKRIAAMSVPVMIKVIAQMKNPRRGHDAQGLLKKVRLDASSEGYSNFMAPMRIQRIAHESSGVAGSIYTEKILKPATDTYLTPEWDEMVPFPNTWKIRFDGFGPSNYRKEGSDNVYGQLARPPIDEDALCAPPFYQPQGPSRYGGSFGVCDGKTPAELEATVATGCHM
ncbi:hypothetical protein LTR05_008316 [Lithohypha guttulata]|uniref:Heme peroxidase n=1 Tax=Lithohypha guttulata TaxID=1690604 RepID=A0AAN7Y8G6_9EURO|nr:hypothetical protein LTR05_008316 [Lithohypha guttulata]